MTTRTLAAVLALTAVLGLLGTAGTAAGSPAQRPLPNGVTRAQAVRLADSGPVGDCAGVDVHCKPDLRGSCTGDTSQTTPPASVRVYVPSATPSIQVVPFETYVEDVLPNEWADSWDGDALKAGAVAITSYTWYWVTHFGGYLGSDPTDRARCFDVTDDDVNFQRYLANSAQPNSTAKVRQVFPTAIRVGGAVLQAGYLSAVRSGYDVRRPATYDACGQGANGTFLSQSGSQTCNENSTADKWPAILEAYYGVHIQLASPAQLRAQHDFQYLHRSTEVTFRAGTWSINDGYPTTIRFGLAGDVPQVYSTGDGFARVGVYRPSTHTWYLGSATGRVQTTVRFGVRGDVPVAAQYRGLAAATQVAVWRPSTGTWYLAGPTGRTAAAIRYGRRGDVPVPGRWTSPNADSIAVYRPSTHVWYLRGGSAVRYGRTGDIPVPADYTGDGRTDIAVYRPANHTFYVRGRAPVRWGVAGDVPVTGDFTGDGRADLAVYRPTTRTWYVRGASTSRFGASGVTPIGKAPYAL